MTERVFVLGAGRAGRGLARALRSGGVDVVGVHGRHMADPEDNATVGAIPHTIAQAATVLANRHQIEMRQAPEIAALLKEAFDQYCVPAKQ